MFSVGTIQFNQNHRMIKVEAANYSEFAKTCLENFVKSHEVNLFLAGLSYMEPLCISIC